MSYLFGSYCKCLGYTYSEADSGFWGCESHILWIIAWFHKYKLDVMPLALHDQLVLGMACIIFI